MLIYNAWSLTVLLLLHLKHFSWQLGVYPALIVPDICNLQWLHNNVSKETCITMM